MGKISKSTVAENSWNDSHRMHCSKAETIHTGETGFSGKLKELLLFSGITEQDISQPSLEISSR
jgi:hypothetical protein